MKKRYMASVLVMVMSIVSLTACGEGSGQANGQAAGAGSGKASILTIGTADSTGTLYPVGAGIASVINDNVEGVKINVETSKGSAANCTNVQNGEIDLGLATGDVASDAVNGTGAFSGQPCGNLRAVAALFPSVSGWMALRSSGMTMVHDLAGKNVSIGPEASASETGALAGMKACGVEPGQKSNLGLGDAAEEVGDGMMDACHAFGGLPIGGQLSVAQTKDVVFLGYTDEELDNAIAGNPSYYKAKIPAGTYPGQDEDVQTFGVKCLLIVNADMDEETVYKFTEALATHLEDLEAAHASMSIMKEDGFFCNDIPIEIHPGALKYYKDAGLIQ